MRVVHFFAFSNPLTTMLSPLMPRKSSTDSRGSTPSLPKLEQLPPLLLTRQLSRSTDDLSTVAASGAEFLSDSLNAMALEAEEDAAIVAQVI